MVTPTKDAVFTRALEMSMESEAITGLPMITPTEAELKESSFYARARDALMRESREPYHEQLDYIRRVAEEIDFAIIDKKELQKLEKCCAKCEVLIKPEKPKPVAKKPIVKKIKKVVVAKPKRHIPRIADGIIEFSEQEWMKGIKPKK